MNSNSVEEDEMSLDNKKKGLRVLLKDRGSGPKDALRSQPLPTLPPHPPPVNVFPPADLKKRKKDNEGIEEGEFIPRKDRAPPLKQQKMTKFKGRASSVDSREDQIVAEVCL